MGDMRLIGAVLSATNWCCVFDNANGSAWQQFVKVLLRGLNVEGGKGSGSCAGQFVDAIYFTCGTYLGIPFLERIVHLGDSKLDRSKNSKARTALSQRTTATLSFADPGQLTVRDAELSDLFVLVDGRPGMST